MWLHASLFAPHVWELLLVCFCLCYSRVDISFVPNSLRCYSVNTLETWLLLQPRYLQTGSAMRRHRVQEGANLSGAEEKTGSHAQTHVCIQLTVHKYLTKALAVWQTGCSCLWSKPFHWRGRVSIVRLMCWVSQRTAWANYHLCMKLSGEEQVHTLRMHMCVFVSECQTHRCVPACCCLFICVSRTPTCLATLSLSPS